MNEHPERQPRRRSLRLRRYDYSRTGAYFITICTQGRVCLFGKISNGTMALTDAGQMVKIVWNEMPKFYPGIEIDEFFVMPNHIHGIIVLDQATSTGLSLPTVVQRLKTMTTKRYIDGVGSSGWRRFSKRLWQRDYFEHVIRNPESLDRIRRYILENPGRWMVDPDNPEAQAPDRDNPWGP